MSRKTSVASVPQRVPLSPRRAGSAADAMAHLHSLVVLLDASYRLTAPKRNIAELDALN
jgi:hypothetical protein